MVRWRTQWTVNMVNRHRSEDVAQEGVRCKGTDFLSFFTLSCHLATILKVLKAFSDNFKIVTKSVKNF